MRALFTSMFLLFFLPSKLFAQKEWYYGDWYGIGYKGLTHLLIDGTRMETGRQNFSFGNLKQPSNSSSIVDTFFKNDLVCLIYKGETIDFLQALVFRKGKDSTYIDMIGNCPKETDTDTATMKQMFFACDSSRYMPMRFYDGPSIEKFHRLKPVSKMGAADLKKAKELLQEKRESRKKRFTTEELMFVEPTLDIQDVTDILINMGYNPMLTTLEYKNLFSIQM